MYDLFESGSFLEESEVTLPQCVNLAFLLFVYAAELAVCVLVHVSPSLLVPV